ncbi:22591_t:CDS:2, partial [Cetraspora pellucida]
MEKRKSYAKGRSDYLPTDTEIDEIIESCILENTYGSDYTPSSLVNAYNCLSNYIYKHLGGSEKFIINNKNEFPLLWEVLNGKMKVLKQSRKTTKHHDPLSPDELRTIFNHEALGEHSQMKIIQFTFLDNGGIQFTKFSQKNDPSGIKGNLDSLIIPIPADPEGYLGPVHDIKLYLSKRPTNCACQFLYLKINKNIHRRTIPITHLFHEGILIVTSMSITGHKSESSYCIYSRPSEQQKKDALSTLIDIVDLPESQNNEDNNVDNSLNKNQDS